MTREILTTTDWSYGRCKLARECGGHGGGPTMCLGKDSPNDYCKEHKGEHGITDEMCKCPLDEDGFVILTYKKK